MAALRWLGIMIITLMVIPCRNVAERRLKMTATNVIAGAEKFGVQRGVQPAKLLIFVTDPAFAHRNIKRHMEEVPKWHFGKN